MRQQRAPMIGYIPKKNIAKFLELANSEVVRNALPIDAKFALGADDPETRFDSQACRLPFTY